MKTWTLLEFFRKKALENVFKKEEKKCDFTERALKNVYKTSNGGSGVS